MAETASRALLPPVKASQIPETEGRNNLLDSVGGGVWWLWILEWWVVKKCDPVCVLNGNGGEGIEGVKCEEGDMEMAGLRMWVMAMDGREGQPWNG